MAAMSQDVFEFFMVIIGIVLAIIVFIVGFWVLDRSRRETPFYSLGYSMSAAWASQTSAKLQAGELKGMPLRVKDLDKMARDGMAQTQVDLASKAETNVIKAERDKLKDEKEELEQILKDRGITKP